MEQLEAIDLRSPTGMKVALAGYRKARASRQLKAVMNNDLAMVTAYLVSGRRVLSSHPG